jgi:hypothetical protein
VFILTTKFTVGLLLLSALTLGAQSINAPLPVVTSIAHDNPTWPKGRAADVSSVNGIVAAYYDAISGPVTSARDWERFKSLFLPEARIIDLHGRGQNPHVMVDILSVDGYIARVTPNIPKANIYEHPTDSEVKEQGKLIHVWSHYDLRRDTTITTPPLKSGIDAIELVKDSDRYWILSVVSQ